MGLQLTLQLRCGLSASPNEREPHASMSPINRTDRPGEGMRASVAPGTCAAARAMSTKPLLVLLLTSLALVHRNAAAENEPVRIGGTELWLRPPPSPQGLSPKFGQGDFVVRSGGPGHFPKLACEGCTISAGMGNSSIAYHMN